MAGQGYVKVSLEGLRRDAAERQLFVELSYRASTKAREVMGVHLSRGQVLTSTRELGVALGRNPMFILRHLRKLQDAGLLEMIRVTLPRPVNHSKIRTLVTVTSLSDDAVTNEKKGVTSSVTSEKRCNVTSRNVSNALKTKGMEQPKNSEKNNSESTNVTSGVTSVYTEVYTTLRTDNVTTTFPPPSAVADAAVATQTASPRYDGRRLRRASRGRFVRPNAPKTNSEGEKRRCDAEKVQVITPGENKPEKAPLSAKPTAEGVETEIRELMKNQQVLYQLRCKSGGMDEYTAASFIREFAGQVTLEGREAEHGMRLVMHFAYWLGKKKLFLDKQQKYANAKQRSAEADRRDLEFLYNFMHS